MIVLGEVSEPFDISGAQTDKSLSRFEFKIDLVADDPVKSVNLLAIIGCGTDSAVHNPPQRNHFRERLQRIQHALQCDCPHTCHSQAHAYRYSMNHGGGPLRSAVRAILPVPI